MKKNKKKLIRIATTALLFVIMAVVLVLSGLKKTISYLPAASVITVLSLLPFFMSFEKMVISGREIAAVAAVTSLAVASRVAFYSLPQIKPIGTVVIIAAICFSPQVGFVSGALSMLISNIFFGQGVWTPFQMFALGLTAFICGCVFGDERYKRSSFLTSLICSAIQFAVYGFIVDTCSVLVLADINAIKSIIAVYVAGVLMNFIFALTTFILLLISMRELVPRLIRLKTKYGLFEKV